MEGKRELSETEARELYSQKSRILLRASRETCEETEVTLTACAPLSSIVERAETEQNIDVS